jgi:hypothetical protein
MLEYVETYYDEKYPDSCFSRQWNQVECMAHVLNLGAQQIFKNFKQIVDKDEYKVNSADPLVTAVSRLAFLCRKMRDSPKLRRGLKKVAQDNNEKMLITIIDVKTRWNSTYDMLHRAVKIKVEMEEAFIRHKDKKLTALLLSEDDWSLIDALLKVL